MRTDVLADVVPFLRCPHCGALLAIEEGSLRCRQGHSFDLARQGYVSLTAGGGAAHRGDTAEMMSARDAFLSAGHLAELRAAVADAAERVVARRPYGAADGAPAGDQVLIVDAGAGTGYYLAGVLDRLPSAAGLALDASKFALRRAARAHVRMGAVGCDVWGDWPVVDESTTLILDVFSPRNGDEFRRVLKPEGALVVVTPREDHLRELIGPLGLLSIDPNKSLRLDAELSPGFMPAASSMIRRSLCLGAEDILALAGMGPSARHTRSDETRERIHRLIEETAPEPHPAGRIAVTISVNLSVYVKNRVE